MGANAFGVRLSRRKRGTPMERQLRCQKTIITDLGGGMAASEGDARIVGRRKQRGAKSGKRTSFTEKTWKKPSFIHFAGQFEKTSIRRGKKTKKENTEPSQAQQVTPWSALGGNRRSIEESIPREARFGVEKGDKKEQAAAGPRRLDQESSLISK